MRIDRTGQRFGKLIVLHFSHNVTYEYADRISYHPHWTCRCDCGHKTVVSANNLKNGSVASCGCMQHSKSRDNATRHGQRLSGNNATPTYRSWQAMRRRCLDPNTIGWKSYGGRGIKICKRWNRFENFFADMGPRHNGKTLDRINANGNYTPSNCRWATPLDQRHNRRKK
jgi:hypothetical protein